MNTARETRPDIMIVAEDKFEMFCTRCWGMRRPEPTLATIEARRHFVTAAPNGLLAMFSPRLPIGRTSFSQVFE